IADSEDVARVEHEHLVSDFDVAHAVRVDQSIDLLDDAIDAPESIAVDALLQPQHPLASLERRLDAAERALVGAPERRVNRRIRLARTAAETVPVVRAV